MRPETFGRSIQRSGRRRNTALAAALLLVVLIAVLVAQTITRFDALRTASSDNLQWNLAQAEVEFLQFHTARQAVMADPSEPTIARMRQRFDIFFSRVRSFSESPLYTTIRRSENFSAPLTRLTTFINETAVLIDRPDAGLLDALPQIDAASQTAGGDARRLALTGVEHFATEAETKRKAILATLWTLGLTITALIFALLFLILVIWRSNQGNIARARAIEVTSSRLQTMITTSLDAILVADRHGKVLEFNGAAEQVFGYSQAEAIGRPMTRLIFPDHLIAAHEAGMQRYLDTGEKRLIGKGKVQLEARRKCGEVFPVEISIATAESAEGEVFVSFMHDISDRVAAEKKLLKARDDALAGERAKARFMAVMSHEMRTPLNGLLGTMDLLSDTELDDRQAGYLDMMDKSGRLLMHHVNDVLDISRIEAGEKLPASLPFDLAKIVEDVCEAQRGQAEANGSVLRLDIHLDHSRYWGHPLRLRQVLTNLIGNAIKFTRHGEISVDVDRVETGNSETMLEIRVADTGIGIPGVDLERIFEDFVTLDAGFDRRTEGTGLGLGIARRMVEAMGGRIGVESEPGEGSVFWLQLPLTPCREVPSDSVKAVPPPHVEAAPLNVLLVEDNHINRVVASSMLQSLGHTVTEARDGEEALNLAARTCYDRILMDISMPRVDGIEVTRRIRAGNGACRDVPIIALTAHVLPEDIAAFKEAGMQDCLEKPINRTRLTRSLAHASCVQNTSTRAREPCLGEEEPPILDADHLADLEGVLTLELVDEYVTETEKYLDRIRTETSRQDILDLVHKLSGSASTVGAKRFCAILTAAETSGKRGDWDKCCEHIDRATQVWPKTKTTLLDHGDLPKASRNAGSA